MKTVERIPISPYLKFQILDGATEQKYTRALTHFSEHCILLAHIHISSYWF